MKTAIKRKEWTEFIFGIYFDREDRLSNCINRAYRDFNRTLYGIGKYQQKDDIINSAKEYIFDEFSIVKTKGITIHKAFDAWYKNVCYGLASIYAEQDFARFFVGQGQKWINMTFKYIFAYGKKYLEWYDIFYEFCHVPIDNILLAELKNYQRYNGLKINDAWSRIENYDDKDSYIRFQHKFRKRSIMLPLDEEFYLWRKV